MLDWLEIWVQASGDWAALNESEAGTNPEIDARWKRWATAMAADPKLIATGAI